MLKEMKKIRLLVGIEGTEIGVRIVPHRKDSTKVVLKAANPEVAQSLCTLMGVKILETFTGSSWHSSVVNLADLQKGLGVFVFQAMSAGHELQKVEPSNKCGECGCDDGTHWPFCPNSSTKELN